ncbi:hypothetical protein CRM22_008067 [Opisthorchis felineus]|uniref:Uncharacterized protein n=1 Tax=Opisthorchis felineus TaxID=147828 RepID=A0A4S2LD70_OPIFE|nr:hypothetical protein CRM22_008067 [Opisthorchis felineus]
MCNFTSQFLSAYFITKSVSKNTFFLPELVSGPFPYHSCDYTHIFPLPFQVHFTPQFTSKHLLFLAFSFRRVFGSQTIVVVIVGIVFSCTLFLFGLFHHRPLSHVVLLTRRHLTQFLQDFGTEAVDIHILNRSFGVSHSRLYGSIYITLLCILMDYFPCILVQLDLCTHAVNREVWFICMLLL